ncbi:MAG: ComF family protein [Parcubacteria group bacterium GW2011_GWA2_45_15]|nr:MAG: ComF family protein [Parcubacteria group bacterium GW2011_GWA2_45_15]
MHLLSRIRDLFVNFLFPRSPKVLELETFSAGMLLETLPRAESLKDKHTMALFNYSHPLVKEVVWELKYSGNVRIAEKLGEILHDHIRHELVDLALFEKWDRPILIPIPISDKRRFERGWNQSELLAKAVMAHDHEKVFRYLPKQLVRFRHTESQTKTASRSERLENLTNSMRVLNALSVAGECVIVIDDVTTTGSTFAEARRALRTAGARKILCVAVAH